MTEKKRRFQKKNDDDIRSSLLDKFEEVFGNSDDAKVYFAPGRVNLIGEHTDYNGGHVFPAALTLGTYGVARKRKDRKLRFYTMNYNRVDIVESSLDELNPLKKEGWTSYPKGVMWAFKVRGQEMDYGMDLLLKGTIPGSSGLSSSASVEVLTGFILRDLYGFKATNRELAIIGQYAENHYNGVNCGIMDQFSIAMGRKKNAIFLNTSTLDYTYVPLKLRGARIIISCSNKRRGLSDSKYNERRTECEKALALLQKVISIDSLGDLDEESFEKYKHVIDDEIILKRARHVVMENQRTIKAMDALEKNEIETFGKLMNESHISLRDDYEVTGIELDTLVEEAWKIDGVIGSRMTGAGFGGCTVSIVKKDSIKKFIKKVGKAYKKKIGYQADFYVVKLGNGPRIIE